MDKTPQSVNSSQEMLPKDVTFAAKTEHIDSEQSQSQGSSESERSEEGRKVRYVPVTDSKYVPVWRRVRAKLRSRLSVSLLCKELNLYGTSISVPGQQDRRESIPRSRRASISDPVPTAAQRNHPVPPHWFILTPESRFKRAWNFVITLTLLYTAIVVPYRSALLDLEEQWGWLGIDVVTNGVFFVDIWVNFLSSYYTSEGELVIAWKTIAVKYAKTWLVCDAVSSFPFYLLDSINSDYSGAMRLARVPRLYRLFRLSRLFKLLKNSDGCLSSVQELCGCGHSSIRLVAFTVSMLGAVHFATCLWCALPSLDSSPGNSWVTVHGMADADPGDVYIAGFYWAFTTLTTVGYGDINPGTNLEKGFAVFWMLFGVCFYSFAIGSFTSLVAKIDTKETIIAKKIAIIDEFSHASKINLSLKHRLKRALQYSTDKSAFSWNTKHAIFNELPKKLKFDLAMSMHQGSARRFPLFTEQTREFVSFTVPFLYPLCVYAKEFVYQKGDYAGEIYFLVKGACALAITHKKKWVMLRKMSSGGYFGDLEVIEAKAREYSYKATDVCDFLCLSKALLIEIKAEFPSIFLSMKKIAEIRKEMNEYSVKMFFSSLKGETSEKIDETAILSAKLRTMQTKISPNPENAVHFPSKSETCAIILNLSNSLQRMSQITVNIRSILDVQREKLRYNTPVKLHFPVFTGNSELVAINEQEDSSIDHEKQ